MQKFVTRKLLMTLSWVCLLAWGLIYAAPQIIIDPTRFVSQQRIQQINLNASTGNFQKGGLVNAWKNKPVLLIGNVKGTGVVQINTITWDISSVIGWTWNKNLQNDTTSLVVWWEKNIVKSGAEASVIVWWVWNTSDAKNSVILASSGVTSFLENGVALWINNSSISWLNSLWFAWSSIRILPWWANSVVFGSNVAVVSWGMFIFDAYPNSLLTWSLQDSMLIRANGWLVIWWDKMIPGTDAKRDTVKLTVHGWVLLGSGQCNNNTIWALYYTNGEIKQWGTISCLCACVYSWTSTATSKAISSQPYCDVACKNTEGWTPQKVDWTAICWTRGTQWTWDNLSWLETIYQFSETDWRPWTDFCKDGSTPEIWTITSHHTWEVKFPDPWETVSWVCPWLTWSVDTQCNAYRKVTPAKCGQNAKKYYVNDSDFAGRDMVSFCETGTVTKIKQQNGSEFSDIREQALAMISNPSNFLFPDLWKTVYWKCTTDIWHAEEELECSAYRRDCNHCAKNGFPYCFDIDFAESCDPNETAGNGEWTTEGPVSTTYTVKYSCNGWVWTMSNQTITNWVATALSANSCTNSWKTFAWWSTSSSATTATYSNQQVVTDLTSAWGTVQLYAVWTAVATYTVHFDCNWWDWEMVDQIFTAWVAQELRPSLCLKVDYAFSWWSTSQNALTPTYINKQSITVNTDTTLYAVWKFSRILINDCSDCWTNYERNTSAWACIQTSCFIEWTRVRLADWTERNIENVQVWDVVLWANWTQNTVLWLHKPKLWNKKLWSINWGKNFFTEEHPFMTIEWWKSLNPGLTMKDIDLEVWLLEVWDVLVTEYWYKEVKKLTWKYDQKDTQLYNLILDGDHTYYADGYLVHNKHDVAAEILPEDFESDGVSCPRNTYNRGWACCPSNTWYNGWFCALICDSSTSTTTYSWTCTDGGWQCTNDNTDKWACSEVLCNWSTQNSCHSNYYAPYENWRTWGYLVLATWPWDPDNWICPNWWKSCTKSWTTYYRCCTWTTKVVKCKSSSGLYVDDAYCSWTKPLVSMCLTEIEL